MGLAERLELVRLLAPRQIGHVGNDQVVTLRQQPGSGQQALGAHGGVPLLLSFVPQLRAFDGQRLAQ